MTKRKEECDIFFFISLFATDRSKEEKQNKVLFFLFGFFLCGAMDTVVAWRPKEKQQKLTAPIAIEYVIAIDIEVSGDYMVPPAVQEPPIKPNSIIAIGGSTICVETGEEVSSILVCLQAEAGHGFEPRCLQEFWSQEPMRKFLKEISGQCLPAKEGIQKFVDWLDEQEATRPNSNLWGDNLAFDMSWLSMYMQKYLGRRSILYRNGEEWRPIRCLNSYARGVARWTGEPSLEMWKKLRNMGVKLPDEMMHDHRPDNDARYIGLCVVSLLKWAQENQKE